MRNISLLSLALILLNLNLFSQLRDPYQHKFFVSDSVYLNSNNSAFSINRFHIGWQWGGERLISKVMKVNQAGSFPLPSR